MVTAVGRHHGLVPRARQVDDRQSRVREHQRAVGAAVDVLAAIVGTAMRETAEAHREPGLDVRDFARAPLAENAAHVSAPPRAARRR
jgi:hypothetical protein